MQKPDKAKEAVKLPARHFERGLVQVYTGTGKGKTTAALGLAIRAAGHGLRVFIAQFMKGANYGELNTLARISNISVKQFGQAHWVLPEHITEDDRKAAREGFDEARAAVLSGRYDVVVLDEINVATAWDLVPLEWLLDLIRDKPRNVELVLTGRLARQEIIEAADLVTEMVQIKHPFEKGISARQGIEF